MQVYALLYHVDESSYLIDVFEKKKDAIDCVLKEETHFVQFKTDRYSDDFGRVAEIRMMEVK